MRTWSMRHTDRPYLDAAMDAGLQVNAGIWLPHQTRRFSYLKATPEQLARIRGRVLDEAAKLRDHRTLMMWTVGNEVLHNSATDTEKRAFTAFLEPLIRSIKATDPHHLVTYAAAGWRELHHLRQVPSLDLIGVNLYGNPARMQQELDRLGDTRPLIFH